MNQVKAAPVLSRLDISGANGIVYKIPFATRVVIQMFTMQGKLIHTIVDKESGPGIFRVDFPPSKSNGPYVVKLQTNRETIVRPVYYTR